MYIWALALRPYLSKKKADKLLEGGMKRIDDFLDSQGAVPTCVKVGKRDGVE